MEKKLYRSRDEQMIAGVCGGLAEYFGLDPTIVRLLFVLISLGPMPGIVVYLILAFIMPERPLLADDGREPHLEEWPIKE